MARPKALISWSSGKDSAFALHEVLRAGEFDVVGALTTVTETFGRVSIHGVRQEILQAQCEAAGLPQRIVPIPYPCPNEIYEARMGEAVAQAVADGVTQMIFGDLFLQDIRAYREQKLAGTGITPVFPLWERPTPALAQAMIASGLEARLATVDLKSCQRYSQAESSMRGCWPICPKASILAARTVSSIPVWWRGRCSRGGWRWKPASGSNAMVMRIAIW
jgi:diphthamide synthase (EF-2-diphthine--ammonia ligase)